MQRKIKTAHENYLADILGVGSGDGDENPGFSSKKLFNLLKIVGKIIRAYLH